MEIKLRSGTATDAAICGRIAYEAFKEIAEAHNFPPDLPSVEVASGLLSWILEHPGFYSVGAEVDSRVVGSNFLDERGVIAGVGPITIAVCRFRAYFRLSFGSAESKNGRLPSSRRFSPAESEFLPEHHPRNKHYPDR
jgi:hypothetical protein